MKTFDESFKFVSSSLYHIDSQAETNKPELEPRASVIIVSISGDVMNKISRKDLAACVDKCQRRKADELYIIVIENNSSKSKEMPSKSDRLPTITHQCEQIATILRNLIDENKRVIIGIYGDEGLGKSTLARYLAWQLHLSIIELDLCRKQDTGYKNDEIHPHSLKLEIDPELLFPMLHARLKLRCSIIIEGTSLFDALDRIKTKHDSLIRENQTGSKKWAFNFPKDGILSKHKPDFTFISEA